MINRFVKEIWKYVNYVFGFSGLPGRFQYLMFLIVIPVFIAELVKKPKKKQLKNNEYGSHSQHQGKPCPIEEGEKSDVGGNNQNTTNTKKKGQGFGAFNKVKLLLSRL